MTTRRSNATSRPLRGLIGWLALIVALIASPVLAQAPSLERAVRASAAADSDLASFYSRRDFRPLWIQRRGLGSEAGRMLSAVRRLAGAGSPEALTLGAAISRARGGDPAALIEAEMRLSRAYLAYVDDARPDLDVGMIYIDSELAPRRDTRSAARILSAREVRAQLARIERGNPLYLQLRAGLAAYRQHWGSLPQDRIAGGSTLRAGARGSRVQALRHRLGLHARGTFDAALARAVRDYRNAHGLGDESVADARTISSLNRGAGHYERLIRANLARAGAIPDDPGRRFILVDTATARLWMYEEGRPVDSMRVIVGKPTEQTPMMAALLRHAALNPYWNVPPDLARERIAPNAVRLGQSYLRERGYEVMSDWSEHAVRVHPSRVDWRLVAAGRQDVRVRQLPGPDNMMGRIKFMMPNHLGIWLHDTPDRHLFNDPVRALSSGCVRLEDADRLTRWLFGRNLSPRTGAPEERVELRRPVPVYIIYLTAAPSAGGGVEFRRDVYDRDPALLAQMESGRTRRIAQGR